MAQILKTTGEKERVETKGWELKNWQKAVGGLIEQVNLKDGVVLIVNEEGKLKNLPINELATAMFQRVHGEIDVIVGDVVVANIIENGELE